MRIEFTTLAECDLENILAYLGGAANPFSYRFMETMLEKVESLLDFPRIGRKVPEWDDESVRELIFRDYRIIYQLRDDLILLIGILHGSRSLKMVGERMVQD